MACRLRKGRPDQCGTLRRYTDMKETLFLAATLSLLSSNNLALAHSSKTETPEDVERRIERVVNGLLPSGVFRNENRYGPKATLKERMAHYHTPGVSIAVVNNYKIEWARGFGVREYGKREPVTENTLFQAASISKPMFALAVMRLVENGKLDLDE